VAAGPRAILITGRGDIFCAGGDVKAFAAADSDFESTVLEPLADLLAAYELLATAPCPVVCVVNGPVGGAGIGLALVGDFVLASTTFKLRTGYAAIGLAPDVGASWCLARRVGAVRAAQWFMTSETKSAEQCLAAGAVDELHAPQALAAAAEALVARLLANAPASLAAIKRLCRDVESRDLEAQLSLERECLAACARTGDAREGVRAFVEKRAPRFTGG
jgi:2-(1,2-epoxy-1,2-dihydrophenyl)acetyl-CoA isomerase